MPFPRSSGLLVHPTSLPNRFGVGDLGPGAYRFVDFLVATKQQLWQVLPLGPTGYGNSPYLCYSAEAGNPLLISPEKLQEKGLLSPEDLADMPEFPVDRVDFDLAIQTKMPLLQKACKNFKAQASHEDKEAFEAFCDRTVYWLEDYSLFMAIKARSDNASWHTWEPAIASREPAALEQQKQNLQPEIFYQKYLQFEFDRQWLALKDYANERHIQIMGDIPFYVAHDSADVWAHPANFCLNEETGAAALMAGVPPDYFSETGQLWGNPVYNWDYLKDQGFAWWLQRFHAMLDQLDLMRIDHFRGLESFWAVEEGETTAIKGQWINAPGEALFEAVRDKFGRLPIIAEDLGIITPEVEALRDRFGFPGMKILHFAFDSGHQNPYLPFNYYTKNCLVYTGTHDNNTTMGWFNDRSEEEQKRVLDYLGATGPNGLHWDIIRLALSSVANQAIIPLQDILGLGGEHRMNRPGLARGNWEWRCQPHALTDEVGARLRHLTEVYGRANYS